MCLETYISLIWVQTYRKQRKIRSIEQATLYFTKRTFILVGSINIESSGRLWYICSAYCSLDSFQSGRKQIIPLESSSDASFYANIFLYIHRLPRSAPRAPLPPQFSHWLTPSTASSYPIPNFGSRSYFQLPVAVPSLASLRRRSPQVQS